MLRTGEPVRRHRVDASAGTGQGGRPGALEPVDEVVITTLVDNVYDALLAERPEVTRRTVRRRTSQRRAQFEEGSTTVGLRAEHGFSALVTVRRADRDDVAAVRHRAVAGRAWSSTPTGWAWTCRPCRAWCSATATSTTRAGWPGSANAAAVAVLPMVVHPGHLDPPADGDPRPRARGAAHAEPAGLDGEGFAVIERREPSLLVDGCVLITGEVDRTTEFETRHAAARTRRGTATPGPTTRW